MTQMSHLLIPLGHRKNISALSLFYRYFVGSDCSQEIKSILPELKTFQRNTRQAALNHPYFISLNTSLTKYFENSFITRTSVIWNMLPSDVFPKQDSVYSYNLQKFKINVNKLVNDLTKYPQLITYFPSPN